MGARFGDLRMWLRDVSGSGHGQERTAVMRKPRRKLINVIGLAMGVALLTSIGLPGVSSAAPSSPPLYPECQAAGPDTGCAVLITVNPDGSTTVSTDNSQPPMSPTGVLVGILNNSDAVVNSVTLAGTAGTGAFALTGQGVCEVHPGPCARPYQFGPTGYEGPGTSFVTTPGDTTSGTVELGGMDPDTSEYFSLASAPITVSSFDQTPDVSVTATPITPYANIGFSGQVGTFTVGYSASPVSDFSATMNWGDGVTGPVSVSQPGGTGTPYVVDGTHTYSMAVTYQTVLTVSDINDPANTGSSTSTATVATLPVTLSPVSVPAQVVGTPFTAQVATFTSGDPTTTPASFTALIDWGDQAGGVEQTSTGTVTQTGGAGSPYTVTGTNNYAASGDLTITVSVTVGLVTSTITEPVEVQAVQVTVPCTGNCSGGVTTPEESATGTTSSDTGSLFVALGDGDLLCAGDYDYAPQVTTVTTTDIPTSSTVVIKVTFLRSGMQGPPGAPVGVCFESINPFVQQDGTETSPTTVNGQTVYIGLLPACPATDHKLGPCVSRLSKETPGWKKFSETLRFPAGDPRAH